MPLMTVRWSLAGRPVWGFCGGSKGRSRSHCASVKSLDVMPGSVGHRNVCGHILEASRAGIERVPQAIAEQVEAEDGQGDGDTGNDRGPGGQLQEAVGGAYHRAPARCGRLVAEAEEG